MINAFGLLKRAIRRWYEETLGQIMFEVNFMNYIALNVDFMNFLWPWKGPCDCCHFEISAVDPSALVSYSSSIFQGVDQTFQATPEFLHPLWCQSRPSKVVLYCVDPVPVVPKVMELSSDAVEVNDGCILETRLTPGHVNPVQIVELGLHQRLTRSCWPAEICHILYNDFQVPKKPKELGYFGIEHAQNPMLHCTVYIVLQLFVKLNTII